jgi:hypothetical protein
MPCLTPAANLLLQLDVLSYMLWLVAAAVGSLLVMYCHRSAPAAHRLRSLFY